MVWFKSSYRETPFLLTWILILAEILLWTLLSPGIVLLIWAVEPPALCAMGAPPLWRGVVSVVSAVSSGHTHSACLVPGPSGGLWQSHTSCAETLACVQSSGIPIPRCPWPCAERTDVCPTREGWPALPGKGMSSRNGLQAGQAAEWRIKLGS